MGLGSIANKLRVVEGRGKGPLLERLHNRIKERREEDKRSPGWHASEIPYLCPRELALKRLFPQEVSDRGVKGVREVMRMDVGSACHAWWQNEYLGPMGILMGDWRCTGCGKWIKMALRPQEKCGCGGGRYEFMEVGVRDPETEICGSSDGILLLEDGKWVFDLKTSSEEAMRLMKEPYSSHVWQVNIYMHLLGIRRGLLVYFDPSCRFWRDAMSRAEGRGPESLPILEFVVEYNHEWWDKAVAKVKEAKEVLKKLEGGEWEGELPKRICENPEVWKARECPVGKVCFSDGVEKRAAGVEY